VLRDVSEPGSARSLLDVARNRRRPGPESAPLEFRIGPLGSGSDYVPFIDHAGIASLNLGFGAAETGGIYHSIYDTTNWFDRFSDGDFSYGRALTQVMTTSILRLADASVLPFEFGSLSRTIRGYVDEIQREAQKRNGNLDVRELQSQLIRLDAAARAYDEQLSLWQRRAANVPPERLAKLNETLQHAEQTLLLDGGLPGRDWYRHQIYAPGLYTGYDAKTLPGIREAVEAQHWNEANQQARRAARAVRALDEQVEESTRQLKQAGQ
jgi:N-acetylated-alpha-linked acidic dipeptidase